MRRCTRRRRIGVPDTPPAWSRLRLLRRGRRRLGRLRRLLRLWSLCTRRLARWRRTNAVRQRDLGLRLACGARRVRDLVRLLRALEPAVDSLRVYRRFVLGVEDLLERRRNVDRLRLTG